MKIKNNEPGFGTIEIILILVIIVLIGAVGWLVYKGHNKQANLNNTAQANSNKANGGKGGGAGGDQGPQTGPAKTEVFLITEWKLSATIPAPPEDAALIQYKLSTVNGQAAAYFTTQELIDSDKSDCTADHAPGGIVLKAMPTDHYYSPADGTDTGQTVAQALQSGAASPYKQVGSYDYWYSHPQGICSTASNGAQLQNDAIKQVQAIVSKLQPE